MVVNRRRLWKYRFAYFFFLPLLNDTSATAQTGTFIATANMTVPRISHTATLLQNGIVLITGGWNPSLQRVEVSAELYDPATGTFTRTGNMTTPRTNHSATLLPDGRVLIAGGDNSLKLDTAEVYDPSTETFMATGKMITPQSSHAGTLLDNGRVLITGGVTGNGTDCCIAAAPEVYDPLTGTFTASNDYAKTGPQNPYGSGEFGMVGTPTASLPNGKVLIAGEPFAEVYDSITGTFSLTAAMITEQFLGKPWYIAGRTATLLTNGKVLAAGGEHEDEGIFDQAELYDPATGSFTETGHMTRRRVDHTATLLRDGTVLTAGSQLSPGVVASAEIYDPATGIFTATTDMTSPRFWQTATLLLDGRVLLAGGYTSWPASAGSASAELYIPSLLLSAPIVKSFQFDQSVIVPGSSYSVDISGASLTPETFFDVRFARPGTNDFAVALNWQKGLSARHEVPAGTSPGNWVINGVRAHEIETDHTGDFFPVSATLTVSE